MQPLSRLYLQDATQLEFDAQIQERRPLADGVGLVLDQSAFYPTSGGQPYDTGTLNGEPVLDVFEAPDGAVVHRVRRAPDADRVHGVVDAVRRRDHMQQHSGQHLLSATLLALLGRDTLSFHLGTERCSIDIEGAALPGPEFDRIEARANEIVWEARPVAARFLAAGEEAALRKAPPAGSGPVRVVEIEGWDQNACCGTHVRRTSEIGLVKLLGQEKVKGGTRLSFACGVRALGECTRALRRADALALALTCHPDAVAGKVDQLTQEARSLRKESDALRLALAGFEAREWIAAAPRPGGVPLVVHGVETAEVDALRAWADAIVGQGGIALLGAQKPRVQLLFARGDATAIDLRPALATACGLVEGKGGGPPARVQGSGLRPEALDAALEAARSIVAGALVPSAGT